jgi:flagellar protein FliS
MQTPSLRVYLENKILTASPEQLQLMLYEGAIRFATVAKQGLEAKDFSKAADAFERLDAILDELQNGLRPEVAPELCGNMAALYNFCIRKSVEANVKHSPAILDELLSVLQHLRESWVMLLDKLIEERSQAPGAETSALARAAV